MYNKSSRLEFFPNEILLLLFQYFNAYDLFQAFSNLNYRFNQLIQSFDDLHLVYRMKNFNHNNNIFSYYVYTLIIDNDDDIDIKFHPFPNIHRLKLSALSKNILSQLSASPPLYLEHLTIYHPDILKPINRCMSLNILKLGCINSLNYTTILSSCPNLKSLDISLTAYYKSLSNRISHLNLQRLIIRIEDIIHHSIDEILTNYFSCVPNLKYLNIHLRIFDLKIIDFYFNYDCFQKIILNYFLLLGQFQFHIGLIGFNISQRKDIDYRMKNKFQIIYNNQFKYRLFIR